MTIGGAKGDSNKDRHLGANSETDSKAKSEMRNLCVEKAADREEEEKKENVVDGYLVADSIRNLDCESEEVKVGGLLPLVAKARPLAAAVLVLLVLVLVVCGAFCWFALRQVAVLRLETELLKLRVRAMEDRVERCNALLLATKTAAKGTGEHHQSPPVSLLGSRLGEGKISSLSSSSSSSSSSLTSYSRLSRLKRNAEKKNKNKNKNDKTKANSQKVTKVVVNFETDQPLPCRQSNCLSLTGWKPSSWVESSLHPHFNELSGQFEIPADGIYYLYAQVTYRTVAALEAYAIMVDANHQMAKCMTGVDYVNPDRDFANNAQSKSCHTGTTAHLRKGQKVWLKSFHMGDTVAVLSMKHTSFWGAVKLQ